MPAVMSRIFKPNNGKPSFTCRICKGKHVLRFCKAFKNMSAEKRLKAVISNNYFPNCLAHNHSSGSCFSNQGCKHCGGSHHSFLHIHKTRKSKTTEKIGPRNARTMQTSLHTFSSAVSLEAITSPNTTSLFPTIVLDILCGARTHIARAVLDPCSSISKIYYFLLPLLVMK